MGSENIYYKDWTPQELRNQIKKYIEDIKAGVSIKFIYDEIFEEPHEIETVEDSHEEKTDVEDYFYSKYLYSEILDDFDYIIDKLDNEIQNEPRRELRALAFACFYLNIDVKEKGMEELANEIKHIKEELMVYSLIAYARKYVKINEVNDNILVNAINYFLHQPTMSLDFKSISLKVQDLYDNQRFIGYYFGQKSDEYTELMIEKFVDVMLEHLFEGFKEEKLLVILDFINYMSKASGFNRIYTVNALYEMFKQKSYKRDMKKLKEFLELTAKYSSELCSEKHKNVVRGTRKIESIIAAKDSIFKTKRYQTEVYALAYAYAKACGRLIDIKKTGVVEVDKAISSMRSNL